WCRAHDQAGEDRRPEPQRLPPVGPGSGGRAVREAVMTPENAPVDAREAIPEYPSTGAYPAGHRPPTALPTRVGGPVYSAANRQRPPHPERSEMPPKKRPPARGKARVGGYTRRDGTRVRSHNRTVNPWRDAGVAWAGTAATGATTAALVFELGLTLISTVAIL